MVLQLKVAFDDVATVVRDIASTITAIKDFLSSSSSQAAAHNKMLRQGKGVVGHAAGGPVVPGGTYLVGEQGPEMLIMGARGGYVYPNRGSHSAGGGGGGVTVNQNFYGSSRDPRA